MITNLATTWRDIARGEKGVVRQIHRFESEIIIRIIRAKVVSTASCA